MFTKLTDNVPGISVAGTFKVSFCKYNKKNSKRKSSGGKPQPRLQKCRVPVAQRQSNILKKGRLQLTVYKLL